MTTQQTNLEQKIEELYEKYCHLDSGMVHEEVFPLAMKELALWTYQTVIPTELQNTKDESGNDFYYGLGNNGAIKELETNARQAGIIE